MRKFAAALVAGAALSLVWGANAEAKGKIVGVSWSNFQEERWKTDEAAMKAAIAKAGDKYISADAQSSAQKQLADVESLIARNADVLIVLAQTPPPSPQRSKSGRRRHSGDRLRPPHRKSERILYHVR